MICAALVTAGGLGKRMGSSAPKQYLDLKGRPVLAWTLLAFESHPLIDLIVVTVPPGDEDFCLQTIVKPFNFEKIRDIVAGGKRPPGFCSSRSGEVGRDRVGSHP